MQTDYDIANQPGASFRSDLNDTLEAIVSNNSGATQPDEPFAYMWWMDTNANILKQRNPGNTAWISKLKIYNSYVNVDNTSDANKPVSSAGQTALNLKANQTEVDALEIKVEALNDVGDVSLFAGNSTSLNKKYGQGWRIADGTDGTPDLIDSFPKLGTFAQRTESGGARNITPTGGVSVSTSVSVSNHTLSIAEMPSHTHNIKLGYSPGGDNGPEEAGRDWSGNSSTDAAGGNQSHNHGASASSSGSFSGSNHTNEPQFTYLVPLYFTGVAGTYS